MNAAKAIVLRDWYLILCHQIAQYLTSSLTLKLKSFKFIPLFLRNLQTQLISPSL